MTNFKGNYITKDDVKIAKNYLTGKELQRLNLLVSQFFRLLPSFKPLKNAPCVWQTGFQLLTTKS